MRLASSITAIGLALILSGCEGDYQGKPGQPTVDIKQTPDLNPRTDHDVQINTPDVDVDVKRNSGAGLPDVRVDVLKTPDEDTKANQP